MSRQIDGLIYSGSAVLAGLRGAPMTTVYCYAETANWALVANPKIKTPSDLKGAGCGTASGPKASPDIACRNLIKAYGGDPASIKLVQVPGGSLQYIEALRREAIISARAGRIAEGIDEQSERAEGCRLRMGHCGIREQRDESRQRIFLMLGASLGAVVPRTSLISFYFLTRFPAA